MWFHISRFLLIHWYNVILTLVCGPLGQIIWLICHPCDSINMLVHPSWRCFVFFFLTGCYFHSSEDSLGWHGAGLHLSDLWTFLPRGDDTREFPREENRIQLDWNLLSIFCSSSVEFSFHFGHNLFTGIEIQFFFSQGKMVLQLSKEPSARLLKHVVRCYLRLSDNLR